MKIKIAFLVYDTSLTGGAETITKQLAQELHDQFEVTLLSIFQEKQCSHTGYRHVVISQKTKSLRVYHTLLSHRVHTFLKREQIAVLCSVTAGVNGIAKSAVQHLPCAFVYIEHSNLMNQTYGKKHYKRQQIGARYADRIVTLTKRDKENYMRCLGVEEKRISVIPNWFDQQKTDATYQPNAKKIISAGRLVPIKGYEHLLAVASIVLRKHKDYVWDIYGEGVQRTYLEAEIKRRNLQEQLILKGNVEDLAKRYEEYALFVLCSKYEGLPMVLLEAQSAHLPIVSFDCQTGPREIIADGVNGRLIKEGDEEAMAQAILQLMEDACLRTQYAKHTLDRMQQFDKQVVKAKWIQLFQDLAKEERV